MDIPDAGDRQELLRRFGLIPQERHPTIEHAAAGVIIIGNHNTIHVAAPERQVARPPRRAAKAR